MTAGLTPGIGFVLSLAATLVLLAGAAVTGRLARRRLHLPLVALALTALGVTIYFAEKLGALYDLEAAGAITPVHLALAKLTTLAFLLPLVTGVATLRDARRRPWHRRAAVLALSLTVVTAVTGTWMLLASERLEPALLEDLGGQPRDEEQAPVGE